MPRTVTVGLDGSPESRAAAEWAAREAQLLGLPVRLVHVWEPVPEPLALAQLLGAQTHRHWSERVPRETAEGLRLRHPGVEVTTELLSGTPAELLAKVAEDAELLALGSRALGGVGGFLIGSVGLSVVARTERPVVLVRAGEQAADEHEMDPAGIPSAATAFRPVVLGLDTSHPNGEVIEFAVEAARRRGVPLRVVHGWCPPAHYGYAMPVDAGLYGSLAASQASDLTDVLRPWRQTYPDVEVVERSRSGSAAGLLVEAAREASLVVVGRRVRRTPLCPYIGHVTHAVLHHAAAPVAVVAHG
ncbi:universal stress protein [Streptomyces sp. MK7]|uniref:universal stress protein n=1 Tax=Streptomyces sp. MK7 TaxID=3067635 RepID=UPI0029317125|nr:universal stress protein [Streptomyces sp. MK7]